jgi:LytS/YehU family sensor histidine kinase
MARESVEKLSEMLRYQLYECTSDKIDITQELEYIKNYVTIQTLRMEKGSDVQLNICSDTTGFQIAPLLILPIVENAFKHVSHYKEASLNKIDISLCHKDRNFIVDASNTYDQVNGVKHLINSGGLGVQNLRRRLELLYPDRYQLDVKQDENMFHTTLKVKYYD